jgi:CopG family transcriptional regulator, nickel-responsive regulator
LKNEVLFQLEEEMANITRFGVSMEKGLVEDFDALIKKSSYPSRSEAVRDLVRKSLITEEWQDPNSKVLATVSILFRHHEHHLSDALADIQHNHHELIISTTHVHLDADDCLEVIILKGKAGKVRKLAEQMISAKGVRHGGVVYTSSGKRIK